MDNSFLIKFVIINDFSVLLAGGSCHPRKWLYYNVSQSCRKPASFLKKIWWLPSVNGAGAHITNIVLTAKGQIFWAQLTQTSRCFMIQFSHHFFSI